MVSELLTMRLSIAPHPSLFNGEVHRTFLDVLPGETLYSVIHRSRPLLALWLFPLGGKHRDWQVSLQDGTKLDPRTTAQEIPFEEDQLLYVELQENGIELEETDSAIVRNGEIEEDAEPDESNLEQMAVEALRSLPETEILRFEEAREAAFKRAHDIETGCGLRVSHRRIFHDEAVDDYDEGYEDTNYFEDVLYFRNRELGENEMDPFEECGESL